MSEVSYQTQLDQKAAADAAKERAASNRQIFDELLCREWTVPADKPGHTRKVLLADCEANLSLFQIFAGANAPLTLQSCEYLMSHTREVGFNPAYTSREELITELANQLRGQVTKRTLSDFDFKNEVMRFGTLSIRELRSKLRELQFKASHPTAQSARDYLKGVRAQEPVNKYPGWPRLLSTYVPKGQVIAVSTRDYLLHLSKTDIYEFKRMCRLYSVEQINDFLAGRN
jgi:hypothetical protein